MKILLLTAVLLTACADRKYIGPPIKGEITLRTGEKIGVTLYPDNPTPPISPLVLQQAGPPAKNPVAP